MGLQHRSGNSPMRRIRVGKRTVKQGEAVSVWNREGHHTVRADAHARSTQANNGTAQLVEGPKLLYLWFSVIRFVDRVVASNTQYLRVEAIDGSITHVPGPASQWFVPDVLHRSISVVDALLVPSSNDVCVVCSEKDTRLTAVPGPLLFFPKPHERVVEFAWTDFGDSSSSSPAAAAAHSIVTRKVLRTSEVVITLPFSTATHDFDVCIKVRARFAYIDAKQLKKNAPKKPVCHQQPSVAGEHCRQPVARNARGAQARPRLCARLSRRRAQSQRCPLKFGPTAHRARACAPFAGLVSTDHALAY